MCIGVEHEAMHLTSTAGDPAMAGMDLPMDMPTESDRSPCDQSTEPGACQVMASCSGGFVAVAVADLERTLPGSSRVAGAPLAAPLFRTTPPEPPPPRV
jgi:hypothetical protein